MDNFFVFYALKVVEILAVVLVVSAIVALIEKTFGVDQTPRHVLKQRALEAAQAETGDHSTQPQPLIRPIK